MHGERFEIGFRIGRIALDDRGDVRPFVRRRAGRQFQRLLRRVVRRFLVIRIDVLVDIRSERQRNGPMRHGRRWVEFRSFPEGADRFLVIERVHQCHALIEKFLGVAATRLNRMMNTDEAWVEHHRPRCRFRRAIVLL